MKAASDRAVRAVYEGEPFSDLPPALYGQNITVNFNPEDLLLKPMRPSMPLLRRLAAAIVLLLLAAAALAPRPARADITVDVNQGALQPMPIAIPAFGGARRAPRSPRWWQHDLAALRPVQAARSVDLPRAVAGRERPAAVSAWKQINAQALLDGQATVDADGRLHVDFRLWDVYAGEQLLGFQFTPRPRTTGAGSPTRSPTPSTRS